MESCPNEYCVNFCLGDGCHEGSQILPAEGCQVSYLNVVASVNHFHGRDYIVMKVFLDVQSLFHVFDEVMFVTVMRGKE